MKTGLRKRETYDELINELERDPIKHYPNRKASQIENSNYMSQLTGDFDEMMQQHERVAKEKMKENLLQQMAASSGTSVHQVRASHGSNFASPEGGARSTWRDGMSSVSGSDGGFYSDNSHNHRIHPAVESDLQQAEWNNLMGGASNVPLLRQLDSLWQPQQITLSSSAMQPQTHSTPQHFSIADDTAESDALIRDLERIMEESGRMEATEQNRRRAIERFSLTDQFAQTTQADEILDEGYVRPRVLEIEDRIKTSRSSAASSSSAVATPSSASAARTTAWSRAASTKQSAKKGFAQPVEIGDITSEIVRYNRRRDWDDYDTTELRKQLKLRKSKDYKGAAINKMDKEEIIEILMIMDVGKTQV